MGDKQPLENATTRKPGFQWENDLRVWGERMLLRSRSRGKRGCGFFALLAILSSTLHAAERPLTYCNPIDLPYHFALADNELTKGASLREAADPTLIHHKGTYWLFASKVGGYFRSKDMVHWDLVKPTGFPTEGYAPSVVVIGDTWLMTHSIGKALYTTGDPASGKWTKLRDFPYYADPELFVDDDGRIYLYWGSSPDQPIFGVELDPKRNYELVGEPKPLIPGLDTIRHGWEARNQLDSDGQIRDFGYKPWMEGATMIKNEGVYYLQYSAPGTEMPVYADGAYTASSPLGPYTYAAYSPFSYKPTGYITSAGHGSTFRDGNQQAWRLVSQLVGVRFMFERRLGLYPAGFARSGDGSKQIVCNTYLGDYPQLAPGFAKSPATDNLAGWMLVSLKKSATASSSLDAKHPPSLAFDEDNQGSQNMDVVWIVHEADRFQMGGGGRMGGPSSAERWQVLLLHDCPARQHQRG